MVEAFEKLELQRKGLVTVNSLMAIIEAQKDMAGRKAILFFADEVDHHPGDGRNSSPKSPAPPIRPM